MGAKTEISWADATFNPWTGCEKVSPACDHCYAEAWAKRTGHPERWQGERARTSAANWQQPIRWNREAEAAGVHRRVFCASLADVFDNQVPEEWRTDLWALIKATPHLGWVLLSKRIGNAPKMFPADWGDGWPNVWLGATVVNQAEADRDIPKLRNVPARVRFLSIEPMLGPIDISPWLGQMGHERFWIICGGESGAHARPMHPDWVRSLRDQCQAAGVPFHFKQWGEWIDHDQPGVDMLGTARSPLHMWTERHASVRVGNKIAGRSLDGRTWDEVPT